MRASLLTCALLTISNLFMTFAWYGHLRYAQDKPWLLVAILAWGLAFFEYLFQVPANRLGHTVFNVGQLKIMQEIISLGLFIPFACLYLREPLRMNYIWAGLCLLGAAYFMFQER